MQRVVTAERAEATARLWLTPVAFATLLVAYNNLLFSLPGDLAFPPRGSSTLAPSCCRWLPSLGR